MRNFIRRTAPWLSLLLAPGTGTRRAGRSPAHRAHPASPAAVQERLPRHRSPYSSDHWLDGAANRLVRPYLAAHEREVTQQRRRLALVLAADFGIDLDHHLIGAGEAAVR